MKDGKFCFDTDKFQSEIVEEMREISKRMDMIYDKAKTVMENDLKNSGTWKGKQREELIVFLNLTLQFHKDLCKGDASPTDLFMKTIDSFVEEVNEYPKNAKSYKMMEELW